MTVHIFFVSRPTHFRGAMQAFMHARIFNASRILSSRDLSLPWNPLNAYGFQHAAPRLSVTEYISLFTFVEVSVLYFPPITIYFHDCHYKFEHLILQSTLLWAEVVSSTKYYSSCSPLCKFGNCFFAVSFYCTAQLQFEAQFTLLDIARIKKSLLLEMHTLKQKCVKVMLKLRLFRYRTCCSVL